MRDRTFHTHIGTLPHAQLVGAEVGSRVTTAKGHQLVALRPTLADFTLDMPRIATVIYPKDMGAILVLGDVFPGARVLEAGTGSGALTIALLRAVGERGRVVSYDLREDMLQRAQSNVEALHPLHPNLELKIGDVYEGFEERGLDRVVLDLPEPWRVVRHAADALVGGGIIVSFIPTVLQLYDLARVLHEAGTFDLIESVEVLMRPWNVAGRSVRPSHRMVGHTGFIVTARRCQPKASPPGGDEGNAEQVPLV